MPLALNGIPHPVSITVKAQGLLLNTVSAFLGASMSWPVRSEAPTLSTLPGPLHTDTSAHTVSQKSFLPPLLQPQAAGH